MIIKFDSKQIYGILKPKLKLSGQATFEIEKVGEAVEKDPNDDFDEDDDI